MLGPPDSSQAWDLRGMGPSWGFSRVRRWIRSTP